MDKVDLSWTFDGHGPVMMGYISPHVLKKDALEYFGMLQNGSGALGLAGATEFLGTLAEIDGDDDSVQPILDFMNVTAIRHLTRDKLQEMTKEQYKRLALLMDKPHDYYEEPDTSEGF